MNITGAVYSRLRGCHDLNATVELRVYRDLAPQNAKMPYVTIQRISTRTEYHQQGAADLFSSLVQVDVWARTTKDQERAAEAIRRSLDGFRGPVGEIDIQYVALTSADSVEFAADAREVPILRTRMDLEIMHTG